ncbi:hypothetical protein OROMI_031607 [Orobanche minor]
MIFTMLCSLMFSGDIELPDRYYGADCLIYVPGNPTTWFKNVYVCIFSTTFNNSNTDPPDLMIPAIDARQKVWCNGERGCWSPGTCCYGYESKGMYVRRKLSYNGAEFEVVEVPLDANMMKQKLVLSLPSYNSTIGYASLSDYNTQKLPSKQFTHGQSVSATVMALPAPATGRRLLLLLKSLHDGVETSSSKRAKKRSSASKSDPNSLSHINVGDVIHGRIRRVDSYGLFISIDHRNVLWGSS